MSADPGRTATVIAGGLWPGAVQDEDQLDHDRVVNLAAGEWGTPGQGLASAVGMAFAEQRLASRYGGIVDHRTWVLASDADLLQDDSHEAASLAGQLGLSRLTILAHGGGVGLSDDLLDRFDAYGWQGLRVGEDEGVILSALQAAIDERERPTLIVARAWPERQGLDVQAYRTMFATAAAIARPAWEGEVVAWAATEQPWYGQWRRAQAGLPPTALDAALPIFETGRAIAPWEASEATLLAVTRVMPELVGVSALHAAGWVCNGIALHGGLRPYVRLRLERSDQLWPAIRYAAAQRLPMVYTLSDDTTDQANCAVEHLAALHAIPGLAVLRLADAGETVEAWRVALRRSGPTVLILTRVRVPTLEARPPHGAFERVGAWTVREVAGRPDIVLIGTGPEVGLCLAAADLLRADGVAARVISMPWRERFLTAPGPCRGALLCPGVPRVVVEAGVPTGLRELAGPTGRVVSPLWSDGVGKDTQAMAKFSSAPDRVAAIAHDALAGASASAWWCERDA